MGAASRQGQSVGYGEKLAVRIITVDKAKNRVECATRDGAMIWAAVWETDIVFRWPEVGETWTVRKDTGVWRLDKIVQTTLTEEQSEAVPKTLSELPEGDTRILGETVHAKNLASENITTSNLTAGGFIYDYGIVTSLPTKELAKNKYCTYKAATGIYWRLAYTGEATYPWAKIGGPPLTISPAGGNVVSGSPGYGTGEIVGPLAMEALADYGNGIVHQNPTNLVAECGIEFKRNGATLDSSTLVSNGTFVGGALRGSRLFTCTKGESLRIYYFANNGATFSVAVGYLNIDPLRVG